MTAHSYQLSEPKRQHVYDLSFVLSLHTYSMFCSERREQSTYCKHCITATINVFACYTVNIYKYKRPKNFKQGDRARRAGAGSTFDISASRFEDAHGVHAFNKIFHIHWMPLNILYTINVSL